MASIGAIWGPPTLRLLRVAVARTTKAVKHKLAHATRPIQTGAGQISLRTGLTGRQPIHPAALLKQQKRGARLFASPAIANVNRALRRFLSSGPEVHAGERYAARYASTNIARQVRRSGGRAPWASTLRPNLTGGAMPRTAGGYSVGGSARYFSHGPAAPAQVVQNVSQAMRAFFLSGQKLRYDGVNAQGNRQYRAVSTAQDAALNKMAAIPMSAPGAFVDFHLSPTLTAIGPLAAVMASSDVGSSTSGFNESSNMLGDDLLGGLAADFGRSWKHLQAINADLERLSALGSLPIELIKRNIIRVRMPGVDAASAERLCDDLGVQRGSVGQDSSFDSLSGADVALQFPFAPDSDRTVTSPGGSARSVDSFVKDELSSFEADSFLEEAFLEHVSAKTLSSDMEELESTCLTGSSAVDRASQSYEGLEGIYRFLEECDRGRGRLG